MRDVIVFGGRAGVVIALCGVLTLIAQGTRSVASLNDSAGDEIASAGDQVAILHALLGQQSDAWNRGDLEAFMQAYWNSPELTFSAGGGTTRGWQATFERYQLRYPNREVMGKLTFSGLETQVLSDDVALTLGRWHLDRKEVAEGNFTLVWKRIGQEWRIIHDHSSSTPATKS